MRPSESLKTLLGSVVAMRLSNLTIQSLVRLHKGHVADYNALNLLILIMSLRIGVTRSEICPILSDTRFQTCDRRFSCVFVIRSTDVSSRIHRLSNYIIIQSSVLRYLVFSCVENPMVEV